MGSAPSLVGVAQASGATSRAIAFAAAGLCVVLACVPKVAAVSLLSLAMVAAIGLNLLFHLGLRRSAQVILEPTGEDGPSAPSLAELVQRSVKTWGVGGDVAGRARAVAEQVIHLVLDGRLADGPITARIAYDEMTFTVEIEYRGDLLSLPAPRPVSEENLVEEQPFVTGLSGFLGGVYADRVRASSIDGRCRIGLLFDA